MPKKKTKEELEVGYFRSRNLSICALFNLNRHDAALLFAHFEFIDEDYTQKVNIENFAKKFLPREKYVFQVLWKYFVVIFKDSRLGLGSATYVENINMARAGLANDSAVEDKEHGSYVEVIAFLFLLVSIQKNHCSHFLYWLIYTVNNETKSRKGLVQLVNKMWKIDKHDMDKKKMKQKALLVAGVKTAVKHLEASALDMKTFQIYDFRVQNAFTIPVKNLQIEIMKKIANKVFWKKSVNEIKLILADPSRIVPRMGEKNIAGKECHRSIGDRKYAWFELRDYIESFFRFHEAANAIVVEPTTLFQKLKRKLFPPKTKESTIVPVNLDTAASDFSLVEKVDERKLWSVDRYYDEAENNRFVAMQKLEDVDEELAVPLPDLFDFESGKGDGVRMKRGSNQDDSDDDDNDDYSDDESV